MSNKKILFLLMFILVAGCASSGGDTYRDSNMDFGSVKTVAIMPIANLSRDQLAADRVRDVLTTELLATGGVYVVPVGEVAKVIGAVGVFNPFTPANDEIVRLAAALKAEAIILGTLKEYGEIRAGQSSANLISLSLQLVEGQTGRIVWSASTTRGGIGIKDRLLGGGGDPMNNITLKAADDLINKLFK
jgi:hypothetical protein